MLLAQSVESIAMVSIPIVISMSHSEVFGRSGGESNDGYSAMDTRIWAKLPEDLMAKVLSFLPISIIIRSALICKSWRSIISSKFFLEINSETMCSHHPWFLIFLRDCSGTAYDPSRKKWFDLPFRFIKPFFRPIAVGDGLICFIFKTPSGPRFGLSICNPISRSQYSIPTPMSLLHYFFIVSGMFRDRETGSLRLVLVGSEPRLNDSDRFALRAEIYCSEIESWIRSTSFPIKGPPTAHRAICNGVLYCILGSFPISIVGFNVARRVWFTLEAPLPPSLTAAWLMDSNNKLVMIGGVGENAFTREIGLWMLDESENEWKSIGWIPQKVCDSFLKPQRQFWCAGHGDLIYFTVKRSPLAVMYEISRNCVTILDPSPRLLDSRYTVSSGFCFEPRLQSL